MIKLKEAVEIMEKKYAGNKMRPFSIVFVKANLKKKEAGDVLIFNHATCVFVDWTKRIAQIKTTDRDYPILVHLDLILHINNEDIA
jgi:hypothetical protein